MAAQALNQLNNDVIFVILDWLQLLDDHHHRANLISLSSTSWHFRKLVGPRVLTTIQWIGNTRFTNASARPFLRLIENGVSLRYLAQELIFQPEGPQCPWFWNNERDPNADIPRFNQYPRLLEVFQSLSHLTNLTMAVPRYHLTKYKKTFQNHPSPLFPSVTTLTTDNHSVWFNQDCPKVTSFALTTDLWTWLFPDIIREEWPRWLRQLKRSRNLTSFAVPSLDNSDIDLTGYFGVELWMLKDLVQILPNLEELDLGDRIPIRLDAMIDCLAQLPRLRVLMLPEEVGGMGDGPRGDIDGEDDHVNSVLSDRDWYNKHRLYEVVGRLLREKCQALQLIKIHDEEKPSIMEIKRAEDGMGNMYVWLVKTLERDGEWWEWRGDNDMWRGQFNFPEHVRAQAILSAEEWKVVRPDQYKEFLTMMGA